MPKCAQREQGLGDISVALHRYFDCRQNWQERTPRTALGPLEELLGVGGVRVRLLED